MPNQGRACHASDRDEKEHRQRPFAFADAQSEGQGGANHAPGDEELQSKVAQRLVVTIAEGKNRNAREHRYSAAQQPEERASGLELRRSKQPLQHNVQLCARTTLPARLTILEFSGAALGRVRCNEALGGIMASAERRNDADGASDV